MSFTALTNRIIFLPLVCLIYVSCQNDTSRDVYHSWSAYNGDKSGSKYSALDQINTENVANLQLAWKFETEPLAEAGYSTIECNRPGRR